MQMVEISSFTMKMKCNVNISKCCQCQEPTLEYNFIYEAYLEIERVFFANTIVMLLLGENICDLLLRVTEKYSLYNILPTGRWREIPVIIYYDRKV